MQSCAADLIENRCSWKRSLRSSSPTTTGRHHSDIIPGRSSPCLYTPHTTVSQCLCNELSYLNHTDRQTDRRHKKKVLLVQMLNTVLRKHLVGLRAERPHWAVGSTWVQPQGCIYIRKCSPPGPQTPPKPTLKASSTTVHPRSAQCSRSHPACKKVWRRDAAAPPGIDPDPILGKHRSPLIYPTDTTHRSHGNHTPVCRAGLTQSSEEAICKDTHSHLHVTHTAIRTELDKRGRKKKNFPLVFQCFPDYFFPPQSTNCFHLPHSVILWSSNSTP